MFRHHGRGRTHIHNRKLASVLSFVAGAVNVIGFIAIHRLTTNVTGHFAFFVAEVIDVRFHQSLIFLVYILAFLAGAFVSNTMVEFWGLRDRNMFIAPVAFEGIILLVLAVVGEDLMVALPNVIAVGLLFAMGLQNALVTKISRAVVRTTHLTGLFTDLGIELSQLIFFRKEEQRKRLMATIQLRLLIIIFFFLGGVAAGLLYPHLRIRALILPVILLIAALVYDHIKFRLIKWRREPG